MEEKAQCRGTTIQGNAQLPRQTMRYKADLAAGSLKIAESRIIADLPLAFDEKLRHYADVRLSPDLDDGVRVNYGKFGDLLAEVKAVCGGE